VSSNRNYRITKFFEVVDKSCKGKGCVKIDLRGNRGLITVNLENLSDGKTVSDVYLFKNRNDKIKIGPINSKRGRLQRSIMLNSKDEPIENYNICGIVVNDKIHMYAPVFSPLKTTQIDNLLETVTSIEFQKVEDIEEQGEIREANLQQKSDSTQTAKTEDKALNDMQKEIISKEDLPNEGIQESQINQYDNQYDKISYEEYQRYMNDEYAETQGEKVYATEYERNLYKLLDRLEPIKPLAHDIRSISWWKVLYDESSLYKGFLPYFNQIITTYYPYPMSNHITSCQSLLKVHGYYLFGIFEQDGKISKFVYGLPGKFTRDQQPYKGVTGFKNWSYKSDNIPGDYGYWLAFIDADTGAIGDAPDIEA
jgi:hypothetical protein